MKTKDAMVGRWRSALVEFGVDDAALVNKHGPCPMCGGKDRFRFDDKGGSGSWYCNQCGGGDGFKLLMAFTGKPFSELAAELDKQCGNFSTEMPKPKSDGRKMIQRIAAGLMPAADITPVAAYLRSRGIRRLPSEHLRYHPSVWHWEDCRSSPAMVAALRDASGKAKGYHITFITERGEKMQTDKPRLYTKGATGSCAIRLSDPCEHLGIAEGIETALSVTELYGVACWATGDAARMTKFQVPEGVKEISIFADMDANYTGEQAAFTLASRLVREGYDCNVYQHCARGTDYNDLLIASKKEAVNG